MSGADDALARFGAAVQKAVPADRDLVAELLADRRAESSRAASDPPFTTSTAFERSSPMTLTHATLAEDGTVAIPEAFRREIGWTPGVTLTLECDGDSVLVRRLDPAEDDESSAGR